ncbi:trigger factor [Lewinella sp. IMCC34183]|uniref:trigger factor n=1 Tax=Lewinella sp. IMCC34183 TaxID=2248762 RepID=UPI000E24F4DB|nr:trigger factor [Lewinella sp. IMCC34183]
MAEVTYEKTGPVTGRIQLFFPKEELSKKLNEELKKESKRVSIKGFRKGKTPLSALRKLMGNQVFGPLLDRSIQQELYTYIEENDLKLIFSPLPDESEPVEQISAGNIKDLRLAYDLGLEPTFELQLPEQSFTKYVLDTNDEFLDELVENLRKQRGETKEIEEGPIEAEDILDVTIQEVDGELTNETKLYVDNLREGVKEQLSGQNIGTTVTVDDLSQVEENGSESHVRKYLLELDEEQQDTDLSGKSFTITVNKISRLVPAELNEEFYIQFDPEGNVTNEEELRERLAEENAKGFNAQGVSMANFEIQRALVEGNDFELPIDLMHKLSKDDQESNFELFERGVRWMLIRNKVATEKEIELQYEDVRAEALESLMRMLGGQRPAFLNDEFLDNYIQNMLKDEKQREELSSNAMEKKVMAAIREDMNLVEQPLSVEEFNDTIKAFNEANTPPAAEEE